MFKVLFVITLIFLSFSTIPVNAQTLEQQLQSDKAKVQAISSSGTQTLEQQLKLVIEKIQSTLQNSITTSTQQVCNFPYCQGDSYGYQNEDFTLRGNPFFCIDRPQNNADYLLSNTVNALGVWQHFLPNLKMHYIIGHDSANCNIFIHFASVANMQGNNGLTQTNFPRYGLATIMIPYDATDGCSSPLTKFSILKSVEHETGHALGLGHFVLHSQYEADFVIYGGEPSPSIMVPGQCGALSHATVTALDGMQVMKLRQ